MGVQSIGIGPVYGNDCCICCPTGGAYGDRCHCNCCPCPATGNLEFTMTACYLNEVNLSCMCDGWTFIMEPRTEECHHHDHEIDSPCTHCGTAYTGISSTTTQFPESWGFSGKICDDCEDSGVFPESPPMSGLDCLGMAITASLCCCKTGIKIVENGANLNTAPANHPCPQEDSSTFDCFSHQVNQTDVECSIDCMWFEIQGDDTAYSVPTDIGDMPSPCSPCATYTGTWDGEYASPEINQPGSVTGLCTTIISGQCGSPNNVPEKKFMLLVTGDFLINCDCQTGVDDYFPEEFFPFPAAPGPARISQVKLSYSGLITQTDDLA